MLVYARFFDGDRYVVRSVWRVTNRQLWSAAKARGRKR